MSRYINPDEAARRPWRVGRSVGRTLYIQLAGEPSEADLLVGLMDTPELAALVVRAVNNERLRFVDTPRS